MKQLIFILFFSTMCFYSNAQETIESNDRTYWINTLTQIADPVVSNMSHGFLRKNMPVETQSGISNPPNVRTTHLEALGRLFVGMAPWLELGPDKTQEGKIREKYEFALYSYFFFFKNTSRIINHVFKIYGILFFQSFGILMVTLFAYC